MIAADIYRPAAIDQLKTLGHRSMSLSSHWYRSPCRDRSSGLAGESRHKSWSDTAGRLQIDEKSWLSCVMSKHSAEPNEILVVDAMIGRQAVTGAWFNEHSKWPGSSNQDRWGCTRGGAPFLLVGLPGSQSFTGTGVKNHWLGTFPPRPYVWPRDPGMGICWHWLSGLSRMMRNAPSLEKCGKILFDFNDFIDQ